MFLTLIHNPHLILGHPKWIPHQLSLHHLQNFPAPLWAVPNCETNGSLATASESWGVTVGYEDHPNVASFSEHVKSIPESER